jgi:STAM-binding protein
LREGNIPQAYLVLFRYSTLVLEYLVKHPEAKDPESRRAIKPLQKRIPRVIELLETLRPEIEETYEHWLKISEARRNKVSGQASTSTYARHAANDPALSWSYTSPANILDARDHQDLAVDLAKKEMKRRREHAGISEGEERRRRRVGSREDWDRRTDAKAAPEYMDDEELRRQMEATRRQLDRSDDYKTGFDEGESVRPSSYHYPSINRSVPLDYEHPTSRVEGPRPQPPRPPKERHADRSPTRPPPRPDKDLYERDSPLSPPPRPGKAPLPETAPPDYDATRDEPPTVPAKVPAQPRKENEERVAFRPAAYLENGEPLRPVFLPSALRHKFLQIAADNTRKGLEMCGMLCGTTINKALFITHLIIPEQKCTSDTCETENESVMLDFCIENELIVIGWIHTHPTQTCFMSSRDLHTQAGYQVMMPESIAIVCAPQYEPS